jgi:hypothetical protein
LEHDDNKILMTEDADDEEGSTFMQVALLNLAVPLQVRPSKTLKLSPMAIVKPEFNLKLSPPNPTVEPTLNKG